MRVLDAFRRQSFGAKWPDDTDLCGELLSCWLGKITGNVSAFEVSNFGEELGSFSFCKAALILVCNNFPNS